MNLIASLDWQSVNTLISVLQAFPRVSAAPASLASLCKHTTAHYLSVLYKVDELMSFEQRDGLKYDAARDISAYETTTPTDMKSPLSTPEQSSGHSAGRTRRRRLSEVEKSDGEDKEYDIDSDASGGFPDKSAKIGRIKR